MLQAVSSPEPWCGGAQVQHITSSPVRYKGSRLSALQRLSVCLHGYLQSPVQALKLLLMIQVSKSSSFHCRLKLQLTASSLFGLTGFRN
ncbi:hypothetical protein ATANTOWER_018118 [Ataeniobius toweri]|uniref:Uncharacterized protein n=1 Tax=Ataeniobius toweri TaxID=208326 RepID=A0ABU7APV2_9TELE|nr:hypothetical protein [Ataeniobius toweri]